MDASGDGKLSHHELEQALVELDIDITTAQAHALVMFMGKCCGTVVSSNAFKDLESPVTT